MLPVLPEKAQNAIDYVGGGGLVSAAIFADLTNGMRLVAMVLGIILIALRIRQVWREGRSGK